MGVTDAARLLLAVTHVHAGAAQHHIEVHAVDTDGGVVLDAQVDVLLDAKTEVAVLREVVAAQLVLADLKEIKEFSFFPKFNDTLRKTFY